MGMTKDKRAPRADEVDVLIAVHVVEIRTLAAGDEQGLAADGTERARRAVDAARNGPGRTLKRLSAAAANRSHGSLLGLVLGLVGFALLRQELVGVFYLFLAVLIVLVKLNDVLAQALSLEELFFGL